MDTDTLRQEQDVGIGSMTNTQLSIAFEKALLTSGRVESERKDAIAEVYLGYLDAKRKAKGDADEEAATWGYKLVEVHTRYADLLIGEYQRLNTIGAEIMRRRDAGAGF